MLKESKNHGMKQRSSRVTGMLKMPNEPFSWVVITTESSFPIMGSSARWCCISATGTGVLVACPSIPVMMDSGIRRGSDILKALSVGAKFVFIGRPFGFASAVGGEAGVQHASKILKTEISEIWLCSG